MDEPPVETPLTRPRHARMVKTLMTVRVSVSWVAFALLLGLVLLTPMAYASPPDPVWVSGFFDDDDQDDVVVLVTSFGVTLDPFPLAHESVTPAPAETAIPDEGRAAPSAALSTKTPRSPPAS
ncbi:MAG TPA: hypothetical protein VJX92_00190 [Methylomirabilota bacterium]|nr:hypothetical protein [Methylomirabilota bacterium]